MMRDLLLSVLLVAALATYGSLACAGVAPEGATTHVRNAQPGDTYRGVILVRSAGAEPTEVRIYQTDYSFTADGRNDFGTPGALPRSNARWLRLSQEQLTIQPGALGRIEYEVRVPQDARLVGTYWSAVMVEDLAGSATAASGRERAQLRQVIRHAIQLVTEIGATGKGELAFDNARVTRERAKRWFDVDLQNTGERWLRTSVWVELHDEQGRLAGRFTGERHRTFPATSVRSRIDLSTLAPGRYVALLVADAGRNDLYGTQLDLDLR